MGFFSSLHINIYIYMSGVYRVKPKRQHFPKTVTLRTKFFSFFLISGLSFYLILQTTTKLHVQTSAFSANNTLFLPNQTRTNTKKKVKEQHEKGSELKKQTFLFGGSRVRECFLKSTAYKSLLLLVPPPARRLKL